MSEPKAQVDDAFALLNAPLAKRAFVEPRSRWIYLALALTLGAFGAHNWFARRVVQAAVQVGLWALMFAFLVAVLAVETDGTDLLVNLMGLAVMIYPLVIVGWIIVEVSSVKECGDGAMLEWSA
ncbi:MAG: hypothetical protein CVT64_05050 [Actinobacteria bacterium HGW-Actinobacteria-4]|nr:MAG: hypothetical protein CVT64_05050 [Actinobacteria bacterium HGW-Actinobacteria-4]